jgi:UDPglucose 6-dehydrogenase
MAKIVIVGSGVVGTATGRGFVHRGHDVTFVDVDPNRLQALRADGHTAVDHIELTDQPATIFLTLPTPNDGHRWDLTALEAGTRSVGTALAANTAFHTVVTRSTVPPGTTEQVVRPIIEEESGLRTGPGFALASNPEFLRAQCADEDFLFPWTTVIASRSTRTVERLRALLAPFGGEILTFSNPAVAEMIKCSHNLFNAAKISFWNEMWQVGRRLGLDANEVASVVARSAEGSFNPTYGIRGGFPYGGACLPKDTKGFIGFARELGVEMPLMRAVDEVNEQMISQVADSIDMRDQVVRPAASSAA